MRKLAYIFFIVLFFFGCGTRNFILNVSYDPIDYPPQFFSPKDKRPVLYIDPVVDNREFAVEVTYGRSTATRKMGRFKEDSTLYFQLDDHFIPGPVNQQYRISKPPSEIIREALETEVRRFGIKTVKDRGLADGVLNASIEKFKLNTFDHNIKVSVKINLNLYQTNIDDPVWSGILKGKPEKAMKPWEEMFNTALSMAIKSWYNYPDFKDALVRLIGNVASPSSPQPVVQQPSVKQQVVSGGTGFLFSTKDYIITNWHVVKGAGSILAKFTNGETVEAKVVAKDVRSDIAVLKLEQSPPLSATQIKLGDSSQARMGEKIFTIGYPASKIMGEKPKYSEGVINAMTGLKDDPAFFQISVPVQPGNSGGPLFNERGEVIGITTASLSSLAMDAMGAIAQNVNYAIKSSFVKNLLSTIPELMLSNTGIVVVPNEPEKSLPNFIEQVSKNIVLIEAKE
jgi:S1-C subfamily serine protease